uniref:hypothetical protein n=1 Tax=Pectobacterium aroidearum TaxID=1201031 RepID=UPI003F7951E0
MITLQHAVRPYHRRQLPCFTITVQPLAPFRVVNLDSLPCRITLIAPFIIKWVEYPAINIAGQWLKDAGFTTG